MKKYLVVFGGLLNKGEIVHADSFQYFLGKVFFLDKDKNNVAMFWSSEIRYIKTISIMEDNNV